ncbi:MAG: polymer-forming cytoskeletal protein [Alphaproteobacteria bacterium]|nr:polymer-forming cytoskeletal protein [Alphaproteobacteria bacterium]
MFGRKDIDGTETETTNPEATAQAPQTAAPTPRASIETSRMGPSAGLPGRRDHTPRRSSAPVDRMGNTEERKLTVGKGLSLAGEISACDILVVEGKVEAKLSDGKLLEITESGQFRGSVEIENADIAGRYDGDLTVHGRLTLRGTGRITGIIKYGELEVNAGGQIIGEMQVVGGGSVAATPNGPSFKSAAKFTAALDEDDAPPFSRKTAMNG